MKKRNQLPKRTTFLSMLLRALAVVTMLSLLFAYGARTYLSRTIRQQCYEQITEQTSRMQRYINTVQSESEPQFRMQEISARMAMYLSYDIIIEDSLSFDPDHNMVQIVPGYSQNCYAGAALVAEDGTVAASSRQILVTVIRFQDGDDPDMGYYVCDGEALKLAEMQPFLQAYQEMSGNDTPEQHLCYVDMQISSAYVKRETHRFIPHEVTMTKHLSKLDGSPLVEMSEQTAVQTREFQITTQQPGYELTKLYQGPHSDFPRSMMFHFYGETSEALEQLGDLYAYHSGNSGGSRSVSSATEYFQDTNIYVDGKPYYLNIAFLVNDRDPLVEKLFWKWEITFTAAIAIIAFLICWRKNVLNKSKYAFEDYQRDLTDQLAHDIKTPLMAISGYVENVLNGSLSETEQSKYLQSILDNVSFTDSLISRTLYLNHMGEKHTEKLETVQLARLAEKVIGKYELLLRDKQIRHIIIGDAAIQADSHAIETILENLISNAVKYTPTGGRIQIENDKRCLTVINSIAERMNTKELKRPFVRGDASRSNTNGNGLGLAIAERAALANGMKLSLSCADAEFRTELKF